MGVKLSGATGLCEGPVRRARAKGPCEGPVRWGKNIAEAAGRTGSLDKARVFGIARGEALEVAAAIEIAAIAGDVEPNIGERCAPLADRLYALLTGLSR